MPASESRRRPAEAGGRQIVHKVRVSDEEEKCLSARAQELGITVSRLLVEAALAPATGEMHTERRNALALLFRLERLIANIANNVNQVAKVSNTTGAAHVAELREHLAEARRVYERIDECLDGFKL